MNILFEWHFSISGTNIWLCSMGMTKCNLSSDRTSSQVCKITVLCCTHLHVVCNEQSAGSALGVQRPRWRAAAGTAATATAAPVPTLSLSGRPAPLLPLWRPLLLTEPAASVAQPSVGHYHPQRCESTVLRGHRCAPATDLQCRRSHLTEHLSMTGTYSTLAATRVYQDFETNSIAEYIGHFATQVAAREWCLHAVSAERYPRTS